MPNTAAGTWAAGSLAEVLFLPDILQFGFVRASFAKSMLVAPITCRALLTVAS